MWETKVERDPNAPPSDTTQIYLGKMNRQSWEHLILNQTGDEIDKIFDTFNATHNLRLYPDYKFPLKNKGAEHQILEEVLRLEARAHLSDNLQVSAREKFRKGQYLMSIARDIRRKRNYKMVKDIFDALNLVHEEQQKSETAGRILTFDIAAIYLMVCEPDKFLVGLRGGEHWKHVELPLTTYQPPEPPDVPLVYLASSYLFYAKKVGKEELSAVPSRPIHPKLAESVILPSTSATLPEYLEDAYYRQRYTVPVTGAEVHFRNAGDLESIFLIDREGGIFAKTRTRHGEAFTLINKNLGVAWNSVNLIPRSGSERWSNIVAETYHDLVTAEEVPTKDYRPLKGLKVVNPDPNKEPVERPHVIYIQRRVQRDSELEDPRAVYTGPRRPPRPYVKSSGFPRRGNMTDKHKEALETWQEETGIEVPAVPDGYTWVRPHFVPADAEKYLSELPIFIKRRIGTQLINRSLSQPSYTSEVIQVDSAR